jgi:hypothetical protein
MADKWKKEWTSGTTQFKVPDHLKTKDKDEPAERRIRNK